MNTQTKKPKPLKLADVDFYEARIIKRATYFNVVHLFGMSVGARSQQRASSLVEANKLVNGSQRALVYAVALRDPENPSPADPSVLVTERNLQALALLDNE